MPIQVTFNPNYTFPSSGDNLYSKINHFHQNYTKEEIFKMDIDQLMVTIQELMTCIKVGKTDILCNKIFIKNKRLALSVIKENGKDKALLELAKIILSNRIND